MTPNQIWSWFEKQNHDQIPRELCVILKNIMKYILTLLLSIISTTLFSSELSNTDMAKWEKTKIEVASVKGIGGKFYKSLSNFKYDSDKYDGDYALIKGDLRHDTFDMGTIHVIGDLYSKLTLDDQSEVVIMGDVVKDSIIYVNDISKIYIGGTLYGSIISTESADIYIKGDVKGLITTGSPSTEIEIYGNFLGELKPNSKKGSLANLRVHGFTDINKINEIFSYTYTKFDAAFFYSNHKPGIYTFSERDNKYYTIINQLQ